MSALNASVDDEGVSVSEIYTSLNVLVLDESATPPMMSSCDDEGR